MGLAYQRLHRDFTYGDGVCFAPPDANRAQPGPYDVRVVILIPTKPSASGGSEKGVVAGNYCIV